jgi:hypothetical protein
MTLPFSKSVSTKASTSKQPITKDLKMKTDEESTPLLDNSKKEKTTNSQFLKTILPFMFLQASVGLCASLQATFYPIEEELKGATAAQFGAVFGIIHLSLFIFGKDINYVYPSI